MMKRKTLGFITIVIGILMIIYTGFNLMTSEKVFKLGDVQMNMNTNHPVQWSPILGVVLLVGGIILVAIDRKK